MNLKEELEELIEALESNWNHYPVENGGMEYQLMHKKNLRDLLKRVVEEIFD